MDVTAALGVASVIETSTFNVYFGKVSSVTEISTFDVSLGKFYSVTETYTREDSLVITSKLDLYSQMETYCIRL